jgi:hypothetical protein
MSANDFLKKFIEMRKGMAPAPGTQSVAAKDVLPQNKKMKKMGPRQEITETGLQHIIEAKPGRKVVEEYLQEMCNELTSKKMA